MRQVREYATGARDQLSRELGPEFEELRKPLEDLRGLRDFNPRTAVRRTLFDDTPSAGETPPVKPNGYPLNGSSVNGGGLNGGGGHGGGGERAPPPRPDTPPPPPPP